MFKLIRTVTKKECPWLEKNLRKGKVVYLFRGCTYGCISDSGVACSEKPGKGPFFEVPADALEKVKDEIQTAV